MIWVNKVSKSNSKNRFFNTIIAILLLINSLIFVLDFSTNHSNVRAEIITVDDNGNADYLTIQEAIDNSSNGDTIYVWAGTYYENVIVNKSVTLIGNGTSETIINGSKSIRESILVIDIKANWVNISGFTITGGKSDWGSGGVRIYEFDNCTIKNNIFSNNEYGILTDWYFEPSNNHIEKNIFELNNCGLAIHGNSNIIEDNIFISNKRNGLSCSGFNNKIFNNQISNCSRNGIRLSGENNTIENCTIFNINLQDTSDYDDSDGINLEESHNSSVSNCKIFNVNGEGGIYLGGWGSHDNKINNCTIFNISNNGIFLGNWGCDRNSIKDCNIYNAQENGIYLGGWGCNYNKIERCIINNCTNGGLRIRGDFNYINNCTISNCSKSGIFIFSHNNTIENCTINKITPIIPKDDRSFNETNGIYLSCVNSRVYNCNVYEINGKAGINLGEDESYYNTVMNCKIYKNSGYGILLDGRRCNNNKILNNEIINNSDYGCYCKYSENNQIYHNYFINNSGNTSQGYDDGSSNQWDNGYPSGGNFWSDYSGIDKKKGSNQNQTGRDGIGDTPYRINGGSIYDNFPLLFLKSPFAPRNLQAIAGNGYIELNWSVPDYDGGSNITNYTIYRGMTSGNVTFLISIDKSLLFYNDTFVINEKQYFYFVTASNIIGESYPSNEANATPTIQSNDDNDNDKIPDYWEQRYGLSITNHTDAELDPDNDNLTNLEEYLNRTDPFDPDTDNDTFNDGSEVDKGTDPLDDEDYPLDEDKDKKKDFDKIDFSTYMALIGIIVLFLILLILYVNLKSKT